MNDGILSEKIGALSQLDNEGVLAVFEVLDEALSDFLRGQPELSPQTLRWLRLYFGFDPDTYEWKRQGCGVKLIQPVQFKNIKKEKP